MKSPYWKKAWTYITNIGFLIGIGGFKDNLKGWEAIAQQIYALIQDVVIISSIASVISSILKLYNTILDYTLFWMPDGFREYFSVMCILYLPFILKHLGVINSYSKRAFEIRFVILSTVLWLAIDYNDMHYSITGYGENLAWALLHLNILYFFSLIFFFLDIEVRFKVISFSFVLGFFFWIAFSDHAGSSNYVKGVKADHFLYSYWAAWLFGAFVVNNLLKTIGNRYLFKEDDTEEITSA